MIKPPFKIGVAGTHSTGKSTFVSNVAKALSAEGIAVAKINDLAARARDLGFPILSEHTFESTLWIMAECIRQEMEASLKAQVILVDRPVPDALGYLLAALETSGRSMEPRRLEFLRSTAATYAKDYNLLILTALDPSVALGEGRDTDEGFRSAAARHVTNVVREVAPDAVVLTVDNASQVADEAIAIVLDSLSSSK